jgi:flagellar basal-body rod modification protein FlgD
MSIEAATAAASSPATATASRTTLAKNFDTFLTLLTSQLKNQDPLSPIDSNEFTQQLVQYSQVEQQIKTNDMLSLLTAQQKATSTTAALSYLGRTATLKSDATTLSDGGANWTYSLAAGATATTLSVLDSSGRAVFSTAGSSKPGETPFTWDGKMSNGVQAPNGTYRLAVKATDGNGAAITTSVNVSEKITGVDLSGADASVTTVTGKRAMADIIAVRE